ncbi:AAA family ATPase [Mucilaginibacter sp. NFR10]|uniref:AAA family ATPase n=1 Tax=Mucilaginibacter sp. NFR10 TaxID=1566292 RepID=UPI000871A4A0|nr:AAA family ATPase [Mucilaginibacter sp. NFR10]SCW82633.1 Predicted ATP-dependent endonuclease of the OLD family, contains P-loop ATPase and TOPRIM domains [Mucilaginibacter sp. NFR10]
MKLTSVAIKNFRSIQYLTISFTDNNFKLLVGKNESGKSNILKALSLLSSTIEPNLEDVREPLPDESSIDESYVRFIFTIEEHEIQNIYKSIESSIYLKDKSEKFITNGSVNYNLQEFCRLINQGIYQVDIIKQTKTATYYALGTKFKISANFKRKKTYKKYVQGETKSADNLFAINIEPILDFNSDEYTDVSIGELHTLIGTEIKSLIKESLPNLMYWQYDEANLLPASINIDAFASDPDICLPLKNLFKIAGIINITEDIINAQSGNRNKLRNLLDRVADHATKHFKSVWKEYDYISFFLSPNGSEIDAGIKEKNTFSLNQRSDGFKRFVTFLLSLSVNAKNKDLSNTVIVIDEPDIGLHPSGVRSLRDELITISDNNVVVASTHSIFLIDKHNISRHYIVKKVDEVTEIEVSAEDNIVEEEVLYKALGYSIYDELKEKNILFEGWRDKKLFKTAIKGLSKERKILKDSLSQIGVSNSTGVKSLKFITPLFELSNKKCLVISDNDKPAIEKQKEFKAERMYGIWKRYDEIYSNSTIKTGEDYITMDCISSALAKIKVNEKRLIDMPILNGKNGVMKDVENWIFKCGINDKLESAKITNDFKSAIFDTLKPSEIKEEYYEFLEKLNDNLDKI